MTHSFDDLRLQCVKKNEIKQALQEREYAKVDPYRQGFHHWDKPSDIDLNAVRLAFQAILMPCLTPLLPVVSHTIYNKKAVRNLTICRLCPSSASVAGGVEVVILCDKVCREDISVVLLEKKDGEVVWEACGKFKPRDIHKQYAIPFKTPAYHNLKINEPVNVFVQLKKISNGDTSEPRPFILTPVSSGEYRHKKCKATNNLDMSLLLNQIKPGTSQSPGFFAASPASHHSPTHYNLAVLHPLTPMSLQQARRTSPNPPSLMDKEHLDMRQLTYQNEPGTYQIQGLLVASPVLDHSQMDYTLPVPHPLTPTVLPEAIQFFPNSPSDEENYGEMADSLQPMKMPVTNLVNNFTNKLDNTQFSESVLDMNQNQAQENTTGNFNKLSHSPP